MKLSLLVQIFCGLVIVALVTAAAAPSVGVPITTALFAIVMVSLLVGAMLLNRLASKLDEAQLQMANTIEVLAKNEAKIEEQKVILKNNGENITDIVDRYRPTTAEKQRALIANITIAVAGGVVGTVIWEYGLKLLVTTAWAWSGFSVS